MATLKLYPVGIQTFSEIIKRNLLYVDKFDAPTEKMTTIMPLLYQSGYITIKGYDPETELYLLDIPNKEIRVGLYGLCEAFRPLWVANREGGHQL